MSRFRTMTLRCPGCGEAVSFEAVHSVNADRRPDLRDAILDNTFQLITCESCGARFRLDPEMTYVDIGRGQWIATYPYCYIGEWDQIERRVQETFDRSYGSGAALAAAELGAGLTPRLTFGWFAIREKIFAAAHGIVDTDLELTKIAVLNGSEEAPLSSKTELRLIQIRGNELLFAWIVAESGEIVRKMAVPRELYDEIEADDMGWNALREELRGNFFVDMQRLMLPASAAAPELVGAA